MVIIFTLLACPCTAVFIIGIGAQFAMARFASGANEIVRMGI